MTFFIVWLICGFICSVIAGTKGRSSGGFFILGLLLGPLGIVIALVLPGNAQEIEREQINSGEMKKCPKCAELVKREAVKCRYCGSDI